MTSNQWFSGLSLLTATSLWMGCGAQAQELTGIFTIGSPSTALTLFLELDSDGSLSGILVEPSTGQHVLTGSHVEGDVNGRIISPHRQGDFSIHFDENLGHYWFVFTPSGPSGAAVREAEQRLPMVRGEGAAGVALLEGIWVEAYGDADGELADDGADPSPRPESVAASTVNGRLLGLWRSQVVINTPGGGFVQDSFMEFTAGGTLRSWEGRAAASTPGGALEGGGGGVEEALFRTAEDQLEVSAGNGLWAPLASFYLEGPSLLLTYYDGHRQLWTKVR